jgi:hypothetical protein
MDSLEEYGRLHHLCSGSIQWTAFWQTDLLHVQNILVRSDRIGRVVRTPSTIDVYGSNLSMNSRLAVMMFIPDTQFPLESLTCEASHLPKCLLWKSEPIFFFDAIVFEQATNERLHPI